MGWTSTRRFGTVKDFLATELHSDSYRILDAAIVNRGEYYAAVEFTQDTKYVKKGTITALVCLIKYAPRSEYNISYKDMSEDMGPCYYNCPKRILDLLTPTDSEYANKWRAECRKRIGRVKPKVGQTVKFAEPLSFHKGRLLLDTFRYVRGSRFTSDVPYAGALYRITGWKDREFTVVA